MSLFTKSHCHPSPLGWDSISQIFRTNPTSPRTGQYNSQAEKTAEEDEVGTVKFLLLCDLLFPLRDPADQLAEYFKGSDRIVAWVTFASYFLHVLFLVLSQFGDRPLDFSWNRICVSRSLPTGSGMLSCCCTQGLFVSPIHRQLNRNTFAYDCSLLLPISLFSSMPMSETHKRSGKPPIKGAVPTISN